MMAQRFRQKKPITMIQFCLKKNNKDMGRGMKGIETTHLGGNADMFA